MLLLAFGVATAQKPIRTNFRADFCIPVLAGNQALRTSFTEIVDINTSYHFTPFKKLTIGPALGLTHFTIDSLNYEKFNTRMFIITPAIDLGYQTYMGENSLFTGSIQFGYALNRFTNVFADTARTPTGYNTNAFSIEPMLRFYFFTGDRVSLGLKLSYKVIFSSFDYKSIYLDKFDTFTDRENSGNTQYFNAGLVFMVGTSKKNIRQ